MTDDLLAPLPTITGEIGPPSGRLGDGRFTTGNPGRPKGLRTAARKLAEHVMADDAKAIAETVTRAAKGGDMQAARLVLERLCPVRRGACVEIDGMPSVRTIEGRGAALVRVLEAVADGEVSPEEGAAIAAIISAVAKHQETEEFAARLERLEDQANG